MLYKLWLNTGDGGSALQAYLSPTYLAISPDGTIYSSEPNNYRIRSINREGVINTVFGKGNTWNRTWSSGHQLPSANSPDGTPATDVVTTFSKIAIGPDGNLYYYDVTAAAIRKVNFGPKPPLPAKTVRNCTYSWGAATCVRWMRTPAR